MFNRLPPLNTLRVFEAAARHLSFTKASEELFVTQAAVSHQIKALEEFLGLKLFKRRNRSLLLTEEGQDYYLSIKEILSHLKDATDKLMSRSQKGTLTVSVPPSFAIQWLVPRLSSFNKFYPDIDVRIQAVDRHEGRLSDSVDAAILYGEGYWPGAKSDLLYAEYLIPVCAPSLIVDKDLLNKPENLIHCTLLHDVSRQDWIAYTKQLGLQEVNVLQGPIFSHSAMVVQAAVYGQGVALVNNVLAQSEIESGRLVSPFEQVLVSKKSYYFVYPENQSELGKIVAFRAWLLEISSSENEAFNLRKGKLNNEFTQEDIKK